MKTKEEYKKDIIDASTKLGKVIDGASMSMGYSEVLKLSFEAIQREQVIKKDALIRELILVLANSLREENE